jgi:colicin import membrane protein
MRSGLLLAGALMASVCAAQDPALERARYFWEASVRAQIHLNTFVPVGTPPKAQVVFVVTLAPDGEVKDVRRVTPSGYQPYDAVTERAIWKSSPLPVPSRPEVFRPEIELRFRPK